jgi:hypothetical protein
MGFVFFAPDHQLNSSVAPSSHLFLQLDCGIETMGFRFSAKCNLMNGVLATYNRHPP